MAFHVEAETVKIGATVSGVELERVDDGAFSLLSEALIEHKVLFFRGGRT